MENLNEKLKNLVIGTTAKMDSYRAGVFYYHIKAKDGKTYQVIIPREDVDGGVNTCTMHGRCKASGLMRWARKGLKENTVTQVE